MTQPVHPPVDDATAAFLASRKTASASEQRVLARLAARRHISRNAAQDFNDNLTLGQRLADRIAVFGGSWTFILIFLALLLAWVVLNTLLLTGDILHPLFITALRNL